MRLKTRGKAATWNWTVGSVLHPSRGGTRERGLVFKSQFASKKKKWVDFNNSSPWSSMTTTSKKPSGIIPRTLFLNPPNLSEAISKEAILAFFKAAPASLGWSSLNMKASFWPFANEQERGEKCILIKNHISFLKVVIREVPSSSSCWSFRDKCFVTGWGWLLSRAGDGLAWQVLLFALNQFPIS